MLLWEAIINEKKTDLGADLNLLAIVIAEHTLFRSGRNKLGFSAPRTLLLTLITNNEISTFRNIWN